MDRELYRKHIMSSWTGLALEEELQLLNAIAQYDAGGYLTEGERPLFEKLVRRIIDEKPDLNQLSSSGLKQLFGLAEGDYKRPEILKDLAYYEVGKYLSKGASEHTLEDYKFFTENMAHGFYLGYEVPRETIKRIVGGIDGKSDAFLKDCRSMTIDRERFEDFCKNDLGEVISDDDVIGKINLYNDGSYIELPSGMGTLCYFMLRDGMADLFAELLGRLYYFPLQGSAIYGMKRVEQCLDVWCEIEKMQPERTKVLVYLLREECLRLMAKEPEALDKNAEDNVIAGDDRALAKERAEQWKMHVEGYVEKLLELSVNRFGIEEVQAWYSNHRARLNGRPEKFVRYEMKALDLIEKGLSPKVKMDEKTFGVKNLETLLYDAKIAVEGDYGTELYDELINRICKHVYEDKLVRSAALDAESFEMMRTVYGCLMKSNMDPIKLMAKNRAMTEGYGTSYDKAYRTGMGDSVWLPIMVLMAEANEDRDYFKHVVNVMLAIADYSRLRANDYYFVAFYLAELVSVQVLKDMKDWFEKALILRVCNLHFVLRVLSANEGDMSSENKELLRERASNEWPLEKELIIQQYKEQTEFLDKYLEKVIGEKV